jgi:uncharacterized membrane protein
LLVEHTTLPLIHDLSGGATQAPAVPATAAAVPSRTSGYVQVVYIEQLLKEAAARQIHVRVRPRVGEHVVAGATLAWIWPASQAGAAPDAHAFRPLAAAYPVILSMVA